MEVSKKRYEISPKKKKSYIDLLKVLESSLITINCFLMLVDVKVEVFHSEARHWLSDRRIFYSPSRDHASSSLTNAIVNNISVTINLANNLGKKSQLQ